MTEKDKVLLKQSAVDIDRLWFLRNLPEKEEVKNLADFSELSQQLLFERGIKTKEEAEKYLNPSYDRDVHDPFLSKDMDKAVDRILDAIKKGEHIIIFGDYDADGIPGAALLHLTLEKIGHKNFASYIPDRYEEEYGLSVEAIERFGKQGTKLVITVDCGITDVVAVDRANELGVDVIITDHHLPHENKPKAFAIINHKQEDDEYPFEFLCGAATAWKLATALFKKGNFPNVEEGWEKWLLDLVGISTICDMVPLTGENRALAKFGLKVLAQTKKVGLNQLFAKAKIDKKHITEGDVAFMVGPRINISSRMAHGSDALRLLTTDSDSMAKSIVDHLEKRNKERRDTVQIILDSIENDFSEKNAPPIIVRGHKDWRIGVLGLTANRLMEKYERPVCLWAVNHKGEMKGSIRSDGSVQVLDLLNEAGGEELFVDFGGHDLAGGFSLRKEKVEEFENRILDSYSKVKRDGKEVRKIHIDKELNLDEVSWQLFDEIEKFGPFGIGNPQPQFLLNNLEITNSKFFGKDGNSHLSLTFMNQKNLPVSALAFFVNNSSFKDEEFNKGDLVDIVATLEKSTFMGRPEVRLRIVDIRKSQ